MSARTRPAVPSSFKAKAPANPVAAALSAALIALIPLWALCGLSVLTACERPGSVHVVRYPSGKVKETWTESGPAGKPTVREGRFQSFFPDGSPESESEYRAGVRNGPARIWHKSGGEAFSGVYRDDFLVRERRRDTAGNLAFEREYEVLGHEVKALGPDGDSLEVLETCAYFRNPGGLTRHGLCRMDYPGGNLLSTRYYRQGRLHGPMRAWHPEGMPWMEGAYDRGVPTGAWKTLSPEGKPLWAAGFDRGAVEGIRSEWHPDGKPKSKAAYRSGRQEGTYQEWYRNGNIRLRGERKDGRREGAETAWYPGGGKLYEARWSRGRLEGGFKQWYPDGKPRLQCGYLAGRKHGPSRSWHRGGGLMEISAWREGRLDGPFRSFSSDGKLLVTKAFKGGDLAFDSKARELIDLLGAKEVRVPVGAFGLYWGMTRAECLGALSVLQAAEVKQDAETISARAALFADRRPRTARLKLRFNVQGELWQVAADIAQRGDADFFPICDLIEAEMGAELGKAVMRRTQASTGYAITRRRDWGRFSLTAGDPAPIRQELPVVTAEGSSPGPGSPYRFTLSNHLFREYVNPANAAVTPPEWPEENVLAGR